MHARSARRTPGQKEPRNTAPVAKSASSPYAHVVSSAAPRVRPHAVEGGVPQGEQPREPVDEVQAKRGDRHDARELEYLHPVGFRCRGRRGSGQAGEEANGRAAFAMFFRKSILPPSHLLRPGLPEDPGGFHNSTAMGGRSDPVPVVDDRYAVVIVSDCP